MHLKYCYNIHSHQPQKHRLRVQIELQAHFETRIYRVDQENQSIEIIVHYIHLFRIFFDNDKVKLVLDNSIALVLTQHYMFYHWKNLDKDSFSNFYTNFFRYEEFVRAISVLIFNYQFHHQSL